MSRTSDAYGQYGRTAVKAVEYVRASGFPPIDAWKMAAAEEIDNENSRKKGCPRSAFICLCEAGLVDGVSTRAGGGREQYASIAVERLRTDHQLSRLSPNALWKRTIGGHRSHQSEMNVVLALWHQGFIKTSV